jgi:hypothetical protein
MGPPAQGMRSAARRDPAAIKLCLACVNRDVIVAKFVF